MIGCIPDESGGLATFTLWALESDPYQGGTEALEVLRRRDLMEAITETHREMDENPAVFGAFLTDDFGTITYATFRIPECGGIVQGKNGDPVTSWREALAILGDVEEIRP